MTEKPQTHDLGMSSEEILRSTAVEKELGKPEFWKKAKEGLARLNESILPEATRLKMAFALGAMTARQETHVTEVEDSTKEVGFFAEDELEKLKELYPGFKM